MKKRILCVMLFCMLALTSCMVPKTEVETLTASVIEETGTEESLEKEEPMQSFSQESDSQESISAEKASQERATEEETATTEPPELVICMVGDILLHDRVEKYALQEDGTYNYDRIFENVKEDLEQADLAIVNQEVLIAGKEFGVSGYPNFNAPFEMGHALVNAGFDVICHGTNHALDKGKNGLLSCINFWKTEYPQIAVLGIYESEEEKNEIYLFEQDGITVAVLNYTYGTNGIPLPADMPYAVGLLEKEKVIRDIEKAESLADFTIVCPHWGTEYVLEETAAQRQWAQLFLENGVDLVLGTHPHVIEPIEWMKDEETGQEMLVYYSLGNYVNWTSSSGQGIANRMVGGMADVTIGPDENGKVIIKDYSVTAVVTHLESRINGVYTTKLSEYTQELSLENEIILQDPNFSKAYCEELCDKVWGDNWN